MSRPPLEVTDLIRIAGAAFLERTPVDPLEACQGAAGHCAVSYRRTRRSCRSMHPLRASCHYFVQQLPQSPLPEVPDGGTRSLDRCASKGTSPDALRPRSLYTSRAVGMLGPTEQKAHLWPAAARQRRNPSGDRAGSQTPRCGNWFFQCAAYLESKALLASPCPLRHSRRWLKSRSHPLGQITLAILSLHQS